MKYSAINVSILLGHASGIAVNNFNRKGNLVPWAIKWILLSRKEKPALFSLGHCLKTECFNVIDLS